MDNSLFRLFCPLLLSSDFLPDRLSCNLWPVRKLEDVHVKAARCLTRYPGNVEPPPPRPLASQSLRSLPLLDCFLQRHTGGRRQELERHTRPEHITWRAGSTEEGASWRINARTVQQTVLTDHIASE